MSSGALGGCPGMSFPQTLSMLKELLYGYQLDTCFLRNFSINPGRGGLFLEDCITHDGNGYVRRTEISSNVTADKGNVERKKRFI